MVTLARLTSSWLSSHTTSWDILLCGNSWLWDLCVLAHADVDNYTKKVLQRQYFGRISEHLPGPCPDLSYLIHLFKCGHLYPLNPQLFPNVFPLPSSHNRGPPPSLFSSCDSWFPCFNTTGHPPVIQHQLSLNTQSEHTSVREPQAKQPQRLPCFHSVAQQTPCGLKREKTYQRHIPRISLSL